MGCDFSHPSSTLGDHVGGGTTVTVITNTGTGNGSGTASGTPHGNGNTPKRGVNQPIIPPPPPTRVLRASPHGAVAPVDMMTDAERRIHAERAAAQPHALSSALTKVPADFRQPHSSSGGAHHHTPHHAHHHHHGHTHSGGGGEAGGAVPRTNSLDLTVPGGQHQRTSSSSSSTGGGGSDLNRPPSLIPPHSILLKQLSDVKEIEESRLLNTTFGPGGLSGWHGASPPVSGAITPNAAGHYQQRIRAHGTLTRFPSNDSTTTGPTVAAAASGGGGGGSGGGGSNMNPSPRPPLLHAASSGGTNPYHVSSGGAAGTRTPSRSGMPSPGGGGTSPMNVRTLQPRAFFPNNMTLPPPAASTSSPLLAATVPLRSATLTANELSHPSPPPPGVVNDDAPTAVAPAAAVSASIDSTVPLIPQPHAHDSHSRVLPAVSHTPPPVTGLAVASVTASAASSSSSSPATDGTPPPLYPIGTGSSGGSAIPIATLT